jgi:tetratricopeptide (TPR) repeat protein
VKLKPIKPLESGAPVQMPKWVHAERLRELYELYKPAVAAGGVALAVLLLFAVLYVRHSGEVAERSSQLYRDGLNLYNYRIPPATSEVTPMVASDEEKYTKAQAIFQQIHETYPGSRLAPAALYYVGNCRFRLKQYSQALDAYELFLSRYPRHVLADEATLGKGDCLEQLSRYQDSYTAYRAVFDHGGPLAYEGGMGAARCLLKLTESDPARWSEAVDILNKLSTGKAEGGAKAAREMRKLLTDLMPRKGSAQPRPQPAPAAGNPVPAPAAAVAVPAPAAPKPTAPKPAVAIPGPATPKR